MKKLFRKEVIIGFCVILAMGILFFGIEYLKGVNIFKPSNYYYAVYANVKGLAVSAPVNLNGVKVGQVDNVEIMFDNPGHVLVQFSIDKSLHLGEGTKAMLESDLLGTTTIRLELSDTQKFYTAGDTVVGSMAAGMMDHITEKVLPGVEDIVPKIDSLLTNLNKIASSPALAQTIENLQAITNSLKNTSIVLNKSVEKLPGVMSEVQTIAQNVDSISNNLNRLSANIANAPIEQTLVNIDKASEDLSRLTAQLNDPDSSLGKLLHESELYDNLVKATADIDSLLVDIKKNPKRYISIKLL